MLVLKQSTSVDIRMGPFVDATDGVTPETGVTLGAADQAEVLKADGAATVAMGGTFAAVTGADGWYDYTVATGDVDTVGDVTFIVQDASVCLPVMVRAQVVEEAVYETLFAASADLESKLDTIDSNVDAILVDTGTTLDTKLDDIMGATFSSATDSLEAIRDRGDSAWTGSATTSDSGTAQAGSTSTITLQSGASSTDDLYNGQVVYISSGTGAGQSRAIGDYVGSTKVATVITNWAVSPDNTSVYEIYPDEITEITAAPTVAQIADGVWDEATAGHTNAGSFGEQVKNDIDAILADTAVLGSPAGADIAADIAAIKAETASILTDTAEIGSAGAGLTALASQSSVNTIDSNVDAILVDTGTTLPAQIGTPVGADISADIAAVKAETANILTDTGTTLPATLTTIDSVVDAIKVQTDKFVFTVANQVDANIQSINDVTITGDGGGTPFDV